MNIQQVLESLHPYVIGLRFLNGSTPVVDTVFKEGWIYPDDKRIKKVKGADEYNYYMIVGEVEGVGLDELLGYVERAITFNLEKEKKLGLFNTKVTELKELFKKYSLAKLTKLKFTFGEIEMDYDSVEMEEQLPPIAPKEFTKPEQPMVFKEPIQVLNQTPVVIEEPSYLEETYLEEAYIPPVPPQPQTYLDDKGKPIPLSEEDREILEEEARAEKNRKMLADRKLQKKLKPKVELPPKRKIPVIIPEERDYESDCNCGPDQYCDKCMEKKGF